MPTRSSLLLTALVCVACIASLLALGAAVASATRDVLTTITNALAVLPH